MTTITFLTNPRKIGGNALVVEHRGSKIALDCGLEDQAPYPPAFFSVKPFSYLKRFGGIPQLPEGVDDVVITHAHIDHYGGLFAQEKTLNVYSKKFTLHSILLTYRWFWDFSYPCIDHPLRELEDVVEIGPICITPINVSHSTIESRALFVETPSARLLYTGDFRINGEFNTDLSIAKGADLVILDGTNIKEASPKIREKNIPQKIYQALRFQEGLTLIYVSPSNLQRISSILGIAKKLGKRVTASPDILPKYEYGIENYDMPRPDGVAPEDANKKDVILLNHFSSRKAREIFLRLHDWINSSTKIIISLNPKIGVRGELEYNQFKTTMSILGAHIEELHASGHSYAEELKELIKKLSPKKTILAHTQNFSPEKLSTFHKSVHFLSPNTPFKVGR